MTDRLLPKQTKETTKIILEYLEKFPNSPSKTLAKKIYSENEAYFENFEQVYSRVRYHRGQIGTHHRKHLKNREFQKELKTKVMQNFVSLPSSLSQKRGTFTFPTGCRKLGVIGDLHIPYHDEDAIETACDKMEAVSDGRPEIRRSIAASLELRLIVLCSSFRIQL
jgi:hypothetical protein